MVILIKSFVIKNVVFLSFFFIFFFKVSIWLFWLPFSNKCYHFGFFFFRSLKLLLSVSFGSGSLIWWCIAQQLSSLSTQCCLIQPSGTAGTNVIHPKTQCHAIQMPISDCSLHHSTCKCLHFKGKQSNGFLMDILQYYKMYQIVRADTDCCVTDCIVIQLQIWQCAPSVPCVQYACPPVERCDKVVAIASVSQSFSPASTNTIFAWLFVGYIWHNDQLLGRIIRNFCMQQFRGIF